MLPVHFLLLLLPIVFTSSAVWAKQHQHSAADATATLLHFCYEDKALEPYYRGFGSEIPKEYPGATIEHLQQLVAVMPGLRLQLERLPWKRCLAKLASGETDAVVASYQPERTEFSRFPMENGLPDPSRAFSTHQTCLVRKAGSSWHWDGERLTGLDSMTIARPLGYAPLIVPGPKQVLMHYTLSGTMDLDLLQAGRVHAVTTLCQIAGQHIVSPFVTERGLEVVTPPLHSNTGYLIFSRRFYQRHHATAEAMWRQLQSNKGSEIYRRYLSWSYLDATPTAPATATGRPVQE